MKKLFTFCLMFCVGVVPALPVSASEVVVEKYQDEDQQKSDRDAQREAAIREKAELMGLGTEVKVAIRGVYSGRDLLTHRGIIAEISDEHLGLQVGDRTLQIDYGEIEKFSLTKNKYKANGQVDPARVRQVVAEVGIGKKAQLKLVSDKKITGTIQAIFSDSFTVADIETGQSETLLFSEVSEIQQKGKIPTWAKVTIIDGVVGFGTLLVIGILMAVYD
ncbi:MAG: hypothetical protein ACFFGZ_19060 [Candidatus Thorarchaeota archaeon]